MPLIDLDFAVRREILAALSRGLPVTRISVMQALGLDYAQVVGQLRARSRRRTSIVLDAATGRGVDGHAVLGGADGVSRGGRRAGRCGPTARGTPSASPPRSSEDVSFTTPCPASGAVIAAGVRRGVAYAHPGRGGLRRRAGRAVVGRHRLHLIDDSALPVGRGHRALGRDGAPGALGRIVPVAQLAALGRRWYRGRLAPDWRPRSAGGVAGAARVHGLHRRRSGR